MPVSGANQQHRAAIHCGGKGAAELNFPERSATASSFMVHTKDLFLMLTLLITI